MRNISGTFQNLDGSPVANGRLFLKLSQDAVAVGVAQVTSALISIQLDSTGSVPSNTRIWFNDELSPTGTTYTASVLAIGGGLVWGAEQISITGNTFNISTAVPTSQGVVLGNPVLQNPAATQTITGFDLNIVNANFNVVNGVINSRNIEQVRYADQFPGIDMGDKINAAIADLPATGGVVDATSFQSAQAAAATISNSKPVKLLLGGVTLTLAGSPGINLSGTGASVVGIGLGATVLQTSSGTADIIQTNANGNEVSGCSFASTVSRTGGSAIHPKGGTGKFRNISIDKTWNGIQGNDSNGGANALNSFTDIIMGQGTVVSSGSWNTGITIGGVASGTIAEWRFYNVVIEGTSTFSTALCELDAGCDTITFTNCGFDQGGSSNVGVLIHKTNTAQTPTWCKFIGCSVEAGTAKDAVQIVDCLALAFINCTIATSFRAFDIGGGKSISIDTCKIIGIQNEGVLINGGSDVRVLNSRIADTSLASNGGSNAVNVSANINDFTVYNCDFTTVLNSVNQPFQNILVNAGTSDRYWITNNTFANFTSAGINDGGTGTNKLVGFNNPFSSGATAIYGGVLNQPSSLNAITLLNTQGATAVLTGNAADQTIYTFTIPAKTIAAGKGVKVSWGFIHSSGTASTTYKFTFGATNIINMASSATGNFFGSVIIMNDPASKTSQRGSGTILSSTAVVANSAGIAPAENTDTAIVAKFTFNVANTDQVIGAQWLVELVQ